MAPTAMGEYRTHDTLGPRRDPLTDQERTFGVLSRMSHQLLYHSGSQSMTPLEAQECLLVGHNVQEF